MSIGDGECWADNHGCYNDGTIEGSCHGMEYSASGVMGATAGCLDRSGIDSYRGYITNTNWSNDYKQYNSFCFCSQDSMCIGTSVQVMPCGNSDTDCATGYHWVSGTGCVQNSGCQNCSSSNWAVNGNTTETMSEATCNSSTNYNCNRITKYRCKANYYSATGKSSATVVTDLNCTACPNGKTSTAGSTSLNACTGGSSGSQTCTASENCGSWTKNGIYEVQSCNRVSTNCSKTTTSKYRCAAGYYAANTQSGGVSSNQNGLNCTRCPKIDNVQSKSNAGGVGKGACCINQGDEGEDDSGPFVIESKCCAS